MYFFKNIFLFSKPIWERLSQFHTYIFFWKGLIPGSIWSLRRSCCYPHSLAWDEEGNRRCGEDRKICHWCIGCSWPFEFQNCLRSLCSHDRWWNQKDGWQRRQCGALPSKQSETWLWHRSCCCNVEGRSECLLGDWWCIFQQHAGYADRDAVCLDDCERKHGWSYSLACQRSAGNGYHSWCARSWLGEWHRVFTCWESCRSGCSWPRMRRGITSLRPFGTAHLHKLPPSQPRLDWWALCGVWWERPNTDRGLGSNRVHSRKAAQLQKIFAFEMTRTFLWEKELMSHCN